MQNRFIDLHILLYDFCGVVVLVGTILSVLFSSLRRYVFLKVRFEMWTPNSTFQKGTRYLVGGNAAVIVVCVWGLILASFLVGMIEDSGLGGRISGFGLAVLFGIVMLSGLVAILVFSAWRLVRSL
jgi:hypothetical protein